MQLKKVKMNSVMVLESYYKGYCFILGKSIEKVNFILKRKRENSDVRIMDENL